MATRASNAHRRAGANPIAGEDPGPQLWDPWLDSGRDIEWVGPEPDLAAVAVAEELPDVAERVQGLTAERARVRPRVISPETSEAIPLEDEIGTMIQAGRCGVFVIAGGPGSGKTTALRHLAAILPPWANDHVRLVDQHDVPEGPDAPAADWETLKAAAVNATGQATMRITTSSSLPLATHHLSTRRLPIVSRPGPRTT